MQNDRKIRGYLKKHRQNSILHKILTGAAAVVVFATTYALILPAITLETKPACGITEHKHNELDCFSNTGEFICRLEEHTHTPDCYPAEDIIASISSNDAPLKESTDVSKKSHLTAQNVSGGDAVMESAEELNLKKKYTDGKVSITAMYAESAQIPEEAVLVAYQVTAENAPERYAKRQAETKEALQSTTRTVSENSVDTYAQEEYLIYNIGFYLDGKEIEPEDKVNITIRFLSEDGFEVGDPITIVHFTEKGNETIKGTDVTRSEEGELATSFDMNSFSDIAIVPGDTIGIGSLALDGTQVEVGSEAELRAAIENRTFNGTIIIKNDFTFSGEAISIGDGGVADQDITIHLNGNKITCAGSFMNIYPGSAVEITDGEATVDASPVDVFEYGKTAVYDAGSESLVYYITESNIVKEATGETQESLVKYTVTNQGIITGQNPGSSVFNVYGGTFTLSGGMLAGSAHRAVYMENGAVANLAGGYICGNSTAVRTSGEPWNGGAIAVDWTEGKGGCEINLSGTVIAGNTANYGGGIHIEGSSVLNIRENAVISGNTAIGRGGGVDAENSDVNMSGGYVTSNLSTEVSGYYSGGGGIHMRGGNDTAEDQMFLTDGYITGNKAYSGGGIYFAQLANTGFIMTGGHVSGNYASDAEGGGIRLDEFCIGHISGGYITNNITDTTDHWGGGGLFIADYATCQVLSVLVTNNDAGGYGGGVAGCSTGRIWVSAIQNDTEGAAIYENSALGTNLSGSASIKQQDHIYAYSNEAFNKNQDYQDYFCMLYSNITDKMLGGGSQNWRGSIDGVNVTIPVGESRVGNSVVGLSAYPTEEDRDKAEAAVAQESGVYINGNSSYTHGGGILCNGYMVLGELDEDAQDIVSFGTRVETAGVKSFVTASGDAIDMSGKEFKFTLIDAETEEVVAKATNDENGTLVFDRRIVFDERLGLSLGQSETYSYILQEENAGVGIMTDETKFKIDITVQYKSEEDYIEILSDDGVLDRYAILKYIYHLQLIKVSKKDNDSSDWEEIMVIPEANMVNKEEDQSIIVDLRNPDSSATFINYALDTTNITVKKEWAGEIPPNAEITAVLEQNGVKYAEIKLNGTEPTPWQYTWTDLPVKNPISDTYYTYSVKEEYVEGYLAEYEYVSSAESDAYWIPATELVAGNQYMIVSEDGDMVLSVSEWGAHNGYGSNDQRNISSYKITEETILERFEIDTGQNEFCYDAGDIKNNEIYVAQSYKDRIILKNMGYYSSWVLIYSTGYWGGSSSEGNASFFTYENGLLQGRIGSTPDAGEVRTITYGTAAHSSVEFTVSRDVSETEYVQPAKLYTLVRTVSGGETTVTIKNTPIAEAEFELDVTKYKGDDNGNEVIGANGENEVLAGAEFELYRVDTVNDTEIGPLRFTVNPNKSYQFHAETGSEGVSTLVTTATGKVKVLGLKSGTYILKETQPPAGYIAVDDKTFTLDANTYNGVQVYELVDTAIQYELPETGGSGTIPYIFAGLLLACGSAACLLYKATKREGTKR